MKKLLFPLLIIINFIIVGCGGKNLLSTTEKDEHDLFSEESFVRYGSERLKQMATSQDTRLKELARCYQGQHIDALQNLSLKLNEFKNDPYYWNQIGTCYALSKNYYKAEYFYNLSLNIATQNKLKAPYAYNNLGLIYLAENNSKKALDLFHEALKINPRLMTPKFNIAQIHLKFGRADLAYPIVSELYKRNPKDFEIIGLMGFTHLMNNKHIDAISYYEKLPELMTRREDIATYYSYALYLDGQFEKSKSILSKQSLPAISEIRQATNQVNKLLEIEFARQRQEKQQENSRNIANDKTSNPAGEK